VIRKSVGYNCSDGLPVEKMKMRAPKQIRIEKLPCSYLLFRIGDQSGLAGLDY
jgi:hypothetical protein